MKPRTHLTCVAGRGGFTVVELLIVIAVLAILAALLLPALAQAKHKALMIKCVSNLHQVGIGLRMYVDDNNETFPPARSDQFRFDPKGPSLRHGDALGGVDGDLADSSLPRSTNRLLARYVPAGEVFHCPV